LSTVYDQPDSTAARQAPSRPLGVWRDTDLQLTGPVVSVLQRRFLEQWQHEQERPLREAAFSPAPEAVGSEHVAVMSGRAGLPESPYYGALLEAMQRATSRIWITAGYFIPTPAQVSALGEASRSSASKTH
jgi:cardiolipin synthase